MGEIKRLEEERTEEKTYPVHFVVGWERGGGSLQVQIEERLYNNGLRGKLL